MSEQVTTFPTREAVRACFPALGGETVFLDNAGGSQLPGCVIDAVTQYMRTSFVQTGAEYGPSKRAAATVKAAHEFAATFVNAGDAGEVVIGPSTTVLLNAVAGAYGDALAAGRLQGRNEVVVSTSGHEANVGPWARLATRGFVVRTWDAKVTGPGRVDVNLDGLRALLSERTLLVAFPQVSNILGDVAPTSEIIEMAHGVGALACVDGVAFAPHRAPDVRALRADWYLYSTYKVFGPHGAVLFGTHKAFAPLVGPNHYFIPESAHRSRFEPGGVNHEAAAGIAASAEHLRFLAGSVARAGWGIERAEVEQAFACVAALEDPLTEDLLARLAARAGVRVIGEPTACAERVCTVSFVVEGKSSGSIVRALNAQGLGCKHGDFYSRRLVSQTLGLDPAEGVVRVSLAHYNTPEEVARFDEALGRLL